jgi:Zn-dependent protease with chaperone function
MNLAAIIRAIIRRWRLTRLATSQRGSVALISGILASVLAMGLAMAVEVTGRQAENAADRRSRGLGGANRYAATSNAQIATGAAADLAEINGASGASSRIWDASTLSLTDNRIIAQVIVGVQDSTSKAIKVTVSRSIAKTVLLIFPATRPA